MQAARLQALRGVERALDPRDPLRRVQCGRAVGLDQLQPDAVGPAAVEAAPAAAAADERADGAHRRGRLGSRRAEWGLYIWLSAVLGARRGEVVALQWEDIDLDAGVVRLDENYVRTADGMLLKDTKTHQMRRVSIDAPTVDAAPRSTARTVPPASLCLGWR